MVLETDFEKKIEDLRNSVKWEKIETPKMEKCEKWLNDVEKDERNLNE